MTTPHRATPEQWANVERWASEMRSTDSCLLELRDRIEALEKQMEFKTANSALFTQDVLKQLDALVKRIEALEGNSQPTPKDRQIRSSAPAGGLVERVAQAIHPSVCADPNLYLHEARAAILAVAEWMETQEDKLLRTHVMAARWLREEVERHG